MIESRYVIIDTRYEGSRALNQYEDILPEGTDQADAISRLEKAWSYATPAPGVRIVMELARMAYDTEEGAILLEPAEESGDLDTYAGYTPIARRE